MQIDVTKLECKRCLYDDALTFEQIKTTVKEYIAAMDEDIVVDEKTYAERLDACFECSDLSFGVTCRYCGCFVQIRALNKLRDCAYPNKGEKKWNGLK